MIHREISDARYQVDALDGLRGFAALIVVFSHTSNLGMYFLPFLNLRGIGKSGVFLFFLLSSFLLKYARAWLVLLFSTVVAYISFKLPEGPASMLSLMRKGLTSGPGA